MHEDADGEWFRELPFTKLDKPAAVLCVLSASKRYSLNVLLSLEGRGGGQRWAALSVQRACSSIVGGRLEACLGPPGALLEAVTDLVWGFPNGKVGLDVAAVPLGLLHLHTQGEILCHGVLGRPACLTHSLAPDQEIGACTTHDMLSGLSPLSVTGGHHMTTVSLKPQHPASMTCTLLRDGSPSTPDLPVAGTTNQKPQLQTEMQQPLAL